MPKQDIEKINGLAEILDELADTAKIETPLGVQTAVKIAYVRIQSLIKEEREKVIEELKAEFEETIKGYNYYCECEDSCGCAYEVLGGIEDNFIDKLVKASKL